jgi:hypothetical protein
MNEYEVKIYDIPAMDYYYKKVIAYNESNAMVLADPDSPYFIVLSAKLVKEQTK